MDSKPTPEFYQLFCAVVNFGLGSKVLQVAKANGVSGGTIFLGKGTVKSHLLELLALNDVRREIVLMIAQAQQGQKALAAVNQKFNLAKPNHGIAFSASIVSFLRDKGFTHSQSSEARGETGMYNAIFTIVEKGNAEAVIDAAVAAGSKGGTIINARGAGVHENSKLFSMPIEPEKEVVMILAAAELTDGITASIRRNLKLDEPGKGIMFTLELNQTYGLVE